MSKEARSYQAGSCLIQPCLKFVGGYVTTTPTRNSQRVRVCLYAVCRLAYGAMKVAAQNHECDIQNSTYIKKKINYKRKIYRRHPARDSNLHNEACHTKCPRPLNRNNMVAGMEILRTATRNNSNSKGPQDFV